jgi:hypothetical protein
MYPDEKGYPYHGPGNSYALRLPNLNVMACVQDFHMNEHGKLYEMVVKTKHAGAINHVAVIPGNHEDITSYETFVRSGGYTFRHINAPTNIFSIIVKISDVYNMERGSRDWCMKDGEAVGTKHIRGMVQFNATRYILPCFLKKPDPAFYVFALCFNDSEYADDIEILYVGPKLEDNVRESELAGKLAGVQFATPPSDDVQFATPPSDDVQFATQPSDDELFSSDDELFSDNDGGDIDGPRESRDDDISNKKLSPDNNAADEVGVSAGCVKKRKYFYNCIE